jgi:hypothetical protein
LQWRDEHDEGGKAYDPSSVKFSLNREPTALIGKTKQARAVRKLDQIDLHILGIEH